MKIRLTNEQIVLEIYRRMFKEAEPSADIDKIIKSGEGKKRNFFMKYYLNENKQEEIIKEVCEENGIKKGFKLEAMRTECFLGSAPTGIREFMLKERGGKYNGKRN